MAAFFSNQSIINEKEQLMPESAPKGQLSEEEALVSAHSETELRDVARNLELIHSAEEKAVLDTVAARVGEKALLDHRAEKADAEQIRETNLAAQSEKLRDYSVGELFKLALEGYYEPTEEVVPGVCGADMYQLAEQEVERRGLVEALRIQARKLL